MSFATDMVERFGPRPCLVGPDGSTESYAEIARAADAIYGGAGGRALVFILTGDERATILAYLGALRAGHAVHMLDPAKGEANRDLLDRYRPEIVVDCSGPQPRLRTERDARAPLHPDIAVLLSTSGSTGAAKFVKLTHRNIVSNTEAIVAYLGLTPADRGVTALRAHYSYGMSVINSHIAAGASLLVTKAGVTDRDFWPMLARTGVTNLPGVPYTFELMDEMGVRLSSVPSLRFVTQAGGKLAPRLVRAFAAEAQAVGIRFYVMYGQTEAAPRISYLPPERALDAPGAIGIAIPGGRLELRDDHDRPVTAPGAVGELVYSGPNVMAGYAMSRDDLGHLEKIDRLRTGDLASRDAQGLFTIVGRTSRFVKPFGLRVALDEIEAFVRDQAGASAVAGDDARIAVWIEADAEPGTIRRHLAAKYGLPEAIFTVAAGAPIPRLSSGKPDYRAILGAAPADRDGRGVPGLLRRIGAEFVDILAGRTRMPVSVLEAFRSVFGQKPLHPDTSFASLGGDSLSYLQLHLLLEDYLVALPENWTEVSIRDLERVGPVRL